jgi:hypothetical protein
MLKPLTQAKQSTLQQQDSDRTPAEQLKRNQALQAVLRQWLDEEVTPEDSTERAQFWEEFKGIVDSNRESGCKLYAPE